MPTLEQRVTKIEDHLKNVYKWNKQVAKILQKVDIPCVVKKTKCKQVKDPDGAGIPSDPPKWPS